MSTKTLSTRLTEDENREFEQLSALSGMDRAVLMKRMLREGMSRMKWELAVSAYAEDRASLSRAAEMAGVGIREFIARMPSERVVLNYDSDELEDDLDTLAKL
jgi:predicted HTH domain antitoxin